jgi:hypothetical protein
VQPAAAGDDASGVDVEAAGGVRNAEIAGG